MEEQNNTWSIARWLFNGLVLLFSIAGIRTIFDPFWKPGAWMPITLLMGVPSIFWFASWMHWRSHKSSIRREIRAELERKQAYLQQQEVYSQPLQMQQPITNANEVATEEPKTWKDIHLQRNNRVDVNEDGVITHHFVNETDLIEINRQADDELQMQNNIAKLVALHQEILALKKETWEIKVRTVERVKRELKAMNISKGDNSPYKPYYNRVTSAMSKVKQRPKEEAHRPNKADTRVIQINPESRPTSGGHNSNIAYR